MWSCKLSRQSAACTEFGQRMVLYTLVYNYFDGHSGTRNNYSTALHRLTFYAQELGIYVLRYWGWQDNDIHRRGDRGRTMSMVHGGNVTILPAFCGKCDWTVPTSNYGGLRSRIWVLCDSKNLVIFGHKEL